MSRIPEVRTGPRASGVQALLARLATLAFRRGIWALGAMAVLCAVAALGVSRLKLDPDITQLLPPSHQSVRNVEALRERFGGVGYVVVLVSGGTPEARRAFADRVAPELEALDSVRYVSARMPIEFFEDRALYFLDKADLETVRDRFEARQRYEIERAALDLDDEPPPPVDFADLRAKHEQRFRRTAGVVESSSGYYEDAKNLAILVRPTDFASNLDFSRKVVADVEGVVERARARDAGGLSVEIAGRYKKRVDIQQVLGRDLALSSTLALLLVLGYVALHFRSLSAIALVMVPLLAGMHLSYGFAGFAFGTLNVLTAFIGAILLGIGIDNGIHLLGRYQEARRAGATPEQAIADAFADAGRVSVAAALTTSVAFGCLALSDFRAFREFGVLAAGGMLLVLFSYVTLLPALLGFAHRHLPETAVSSEALRLPGVPRLMRVAPRLALGLGLLSVALFAAAPSVRFNADFSALDRADARSFELDPTINQLLGRSQTPLVFLTNSAAEARDVAGILRARMTELGSAATVGLIATRSDLVPEDQLEKRPIIERIRRVASRIDEEKLSATERERLEQLRRMAAAEPFSIEDLPAAVRKQFEPRTPGPVHFVLAYPTVSMGEAAAVRALAEQLGSVDLGGGRVLSAAGEAMILADVLETVSRDGPRILLLTLVLVLGALRLMAGSMRLALLSLFPAVLTLGVSAGLLAALGVELNYLNMIMLPILLGIGVDDGMHVVTRVAAGDVLETVWAHTGWNIFGAILTDLFGFGVLAFASHPGLASLGKVAIVGLLVNLVTCVLLLPALLASSRLLVPRAPPFSSVRSGLDEPSRDPT